MNKRKFVNVDAFENGKFSVYVDCDAVFDDESLSLLREYQRLVGDYDSSFFGVSVSLLNSALQYAIDKKVKDLELLAIEKQLEELRWHLSHCD